MEMESEWIQGRERSEWGGGVEGQETIWYYHVRDDLSMFNYLTKETQNTYVLA